jgi:hypothetical protein
MLKHGGYFTLTQYLHLDVVLVSIYMTVDRLDVRWTEARHRTECLRSLCM